MTQPQTGCHFQAEFTTITTAGTRVQLSSADEHISRITFRGDPDNTGNIGIGKSDVSMTSASWVLKPGESVTLNFGEKSVLLTDFWVDAATNGDKLNWIVGAELITGAGSQGPIAHSATTGKTAGDHHAQSHTHALADYTTSRLSGSTTVSANTISQIVIQSVGDVHRHYTCSIRETDGLPRWGHGATVSATETVLEGPHSLIRRSSTSALSDILDLVNGTGTSETADYEVLEFD